MIYLVPVEFRIEANSADEASKLIELSLELRNYPHMVHQGCREDVKDVTVSPELTAIFEKDLSENGDDPNGWETTLEWCLNHNGYANKELETLISNVGGAVKAANFIP